jgi:predicted nuclease with TOPRIM domain
MKTRIKNWLISAGLKAVGLGTNIETISDTIEELSKTNQDLSAKAAALQEEVDGLKLKWRKVQERNDKLEFDAREIAAEGLLVKAHEIKRDTTMLIITTKNMSIVNSASYANLTNRLQNICRHLDAIVMLCDDPKIDQPTPEEAAERFNVITIPDRESWIAKREESLAHIADLFDRHSKSKYNY